MYKNFGKRFFDLIGSIVALNFLVPIIVIVYTVIKIFDRGPVIFKQERVGLNGKLFTLYKFRSLPVGTEDCPSSELKSIKESLIGKVLRRTNIDEMPQLFNILKGEMSFVGPRPCLESQIYLCKQRKLNGAICCRPGVTGLAQVRSFDGMTLEEKAQLDGKYARSVSFKNDLHILVKTVGYLLRRPPVY